MRRYRGAHRLFADPRPNLLARPRRLPRAVLYLPQQVRRQSRKARVKTLPQMARPSQAQRIKAARDAARELDLAKQRVTVRCAHCKGPGRRFKFTGAVREASERFAEHRAQAHPELTPIELCKTTQRRSRRRAAVGMASNTRDGFYARREYQSPQELREREELRRLARTDLAPIDEAA